MNSFKTLNNLTGGLVFLITFIVMCFSVESSGSLWDCGEFVSGAFKLQVVHPPGAPLFLLVGRIFTMFAELFSKDPSNIAFSVNLMSGMCNALTAMFVCWSAVILAKLALVGRDGELDMPQSIAVLGGGLVAGLCTAFCSSIWFSAVEGEVYAMSTFFTALTVWAVMKWYNLPDNSNSDRWLLFAVYAAGLSTGVHLLSLLTFPALALFYYFKKYKNHTLIGVGVAFAIGVAFILGTQVLVITGVPKLWYWMEMLTVNTFGLPVNSGIVPTLMVLVGGFFFGFRYAAQKQNAILQKILMSALLLVIGFSTIGIVVIRANANTPINMNNPSNPMSLLPYINREQYGERPLLFGPHFDAKPNGTKMDDRYGLAGDHYEVTGRKLDYEFKDEDKMLFPRIGHYEQGRPQQHRLWMGNRQGVPTQADNMHFFFQYQLGWMYWRYFMWNFVGRQNGEQGYYPWDLANGHWLSGINAVDNAMLYNQDQITTTMKKHQARNTYYFLPLIFGLLGMFFHFRKSKEDFAGLLGLFIITGIGIIIYSNQPPNEPRERDYVLVGSFFTFCIWIGLGVVAVFDFLWNRVKLTNIASPILAIALALSAPIVMGFQNYDDHSRRGHYATRDYAANFLVSCDKDAIIFTYGDNDTYPLWYAQEVENIRPDVRVVNLSLIAVDWYINQLRRKINESPAIKMTIPEDAYRGFRRDQIPYYAPNGEREMSIMDAIKFIGGNNKVSGSGVEFESFLPSTDLYIPVDVAKARANGYATAKDSVLSKVSFSLGKRNSVIKDDIAILDIVATNAFERPIYWAVTCRQEKMMGLQDFTQLEGMGLKLVPFKNPSDQQYGLVGNGKVNVDKTYDIVMNRWKWGNFDKMETYVDKSYMPSIQAMRLIILRTAREAALEGDKKKAVDLIDKYFESFPHKNFPYDYSAFYMLTVYVQSDAYEKAKPHLKILENELLEQFKFYNSLDPKDLQSGFEQDYGMSARTKDDMIKLVEQAKDVDYAKELKEKFAPYSSDKKPN